MRILLIHQAFVSPKEAGGTRHFELSQHCRKQGIDFSIIASDISYLTGGKVNGKGGLISTEIVQDTIIYRAYTYPALHKSFVWRVFSFISFMLSSIVAALRVKDVNAVIGTSPPIFQAFSAWLAAFIKGVPFILEVRDLWPEFAVDMGVLKNRALIKLSYRFARFLYARATHIIVNSPAYRDHLISIGVSENKISLIPNGVDIGMFPMNSNGKLVRADLGLNGQFVVTYAGAIGLANDIPLILKAAERLCDRPEIHFLVVGDGKERRNMEDMARGMGLRNVTFTGAMPKSRMPDVMSASDACLAVLQNIPMFKTTYPNKVFDYMASSKPTILAIDGVIREVVEMAGGGIFVPPGDDQALAQAVCQLSENPEQTMEMGDSARKYVAKYFNREKQAEKFVSLLHSIAQ